MAYKNIEALVEKVEEFHPVYLWDDLSNYLHIKEEIAEAVKQKDIFTAFKEMSRLTSIYGRLTRVSKFEYYPGNMGDITEEIAKLTKTIDEIQKDFIVATMEIEYEYCHHSFTGDFEITKEALEADWLLVDWEAYHNKNLKRFMEACKKADKIYNIDIKDIIEYYADDSRFNFVEVYPTEYNQRVIGVFDNEDDAYYWADDYSEVEEIGELYYVNHAGY